MPTRRAGRCAREASFPQGAHRRAAGTPEDAGNTRSARWDPARSGRRALTAGEAIERILAAQLALRNGRRLATAVRSSRLPGVKTLTEFDFSFQPCLRREQIDSLHELGFLERRYNVVFLGPPGVGMRHLAISIAVAASESGRRINFGPLGDLIDSLDEAHAAGRLNQRLKRLTHPALLVVDEIGYLSVTANGARLFFQLINSRYGHASTVVTSNKGLRTGGTSCTTRSWRLLCWTGSCTGATSSTSGATAIGCAATRTSPQSFIRRP